jgi:hypothetical protein
METKRKTALHAISPPERVLRGKKKKGGRGGAKFKGKSLKAKAQRSKLKAKAW